MTGFTLLLWYCSALNDKNTEIKVGNNAAISCGSCLWTLLTSSTASSLSCNGVVVSAIMGKEQEGRKVTFTTWWKISFVKAGSDIEWRSILESHREVNESRREILTTSVVEEVVRGNLGPLRSHCPKVWNAVRDNYRSDITWVVLPRASCMTSDMGIFVHWVSRHSVNVRGTSYCDFTLCFFWVTNSLHSWLLLLSSLCRETYKPRAQYIMQTFSSQMKDWLQTALLLSTKDIASQFTISSC